MPRAHKNAMLALWVLYGVFWTGGVYTSCAPSSHPAPRWTSPFFLWLSAGIVVLDGLEWRAAACFACGGFFAEAAGVWIGVPFGRYTYSGTLGPSIAGVPLSISCAWLILLACSRDLASRVAHSLPARVTIGAALTAAADLLIDPVATRTLHFWTWNHPGPWFGVPIQNFIGWFVVSAALLAAGGHAKERSDTAVRMGIATVMFFAVVAFGRWE